MPKRTLENAKKEKNDEFYTQIEDIISEIENHKDYARNFENKVVLCNCDNPESSNFVKFFVKSFEKFKLKKLIATYYNADSSHSYKFEWFKTENQSAVSMIKTSLKGNGDFRSEESINLLKEADIIATNPPFSLFKEFIIQLLNYNKQFIIIGNINAITYKEVFPFLKNNKIWFGYGFNIPMVFKTKYPNLSESNRKYVISKGYNPDDGFVKVPGLTWYTNLPINKRNEYLKLTKKYKGNERYYPSYDNYDAINCDKTSDIPKDYKGIIGVPITFLKVFNPEQFKIVGLSSKSNMGEVKKKKPDSFYKGYTRGKVSTGIDSSLPILEIPDSGGTVCKKQGCKDLYQLYWRIFVKKIK